MCLPDWIFNALIIVYYCYYFQSLYVPWNILNTYQWWFQLKLSFIISCYKYHFTVLSKNNLLRNIEFLLLHLSWKLEKCKVIAYWLKPLAAGNCTWLESTCWLTSSLDLRETPSIFTTYVIRVAFAAEIANHNKKCKRCSSKIQLWHKSHVVCALQLVWRRFCLTLQCIFTSRTPSECPGSTIIQLLSARSITGQNV